MKVECNEFVAKFVTKSNTCRNVVLTNLILLKLYRKIVPLNAKLY